MAGREQLRGTGRRSFTAIGLLQAMTSRTTSRRVSCTSFRPARGKKFANSGASRWIFGDWQINGVFAAYSGRPFTVTAAAGALNAPGNTQTADQVKPVVEKLGGVGSGQPFFDPTAFAAPVGVRFGSSGRNILRGPGAVNLDLGVFRRFPIREQMSFEFRAEAANATNTPHFNNPNANISAANFLVVTSAVPDQRQLRLGLRLMW